MSFEFWTQKFIIIFGAIEDKGRLTAMRTDYNNLTKKTLVWPELDKLDNKIIYNNKVVSKLLITILHFLLFVLEKTGNG